MFTLFYNFFAVAIFHLARKIKRAPHRLRGYQDKEFEHGYPWKAMIPILWQLDKSMLVSNVVARTKKHMKYLFRDDTMPFKDFKDLKEHQAKSKKKTGDKKDVSLPKEEIKSKISKNAVDMKGHHKKGDA